MPRPGNNRVVATGIIASTSPAQRMTTASNWPPSSRARLSTRPSIIRTPGSWIVRMALVRNIARRRRDSIRVSSRSRRTILSGSPGRPAPEPTSASDLTAGGRSPRKRRLSRKRCSTIHNGSAEPTRRWAFCHLTNKPRYLSKSSLSPAVRGLPRMVAAPSSRASSGVTCRGRTSRRCGPAQRRPRRRPGLLR